MVPVEGLTFSTLIEMGDCLKIFARKGGGKEKWVRLV